MDNTKIGYANFESITALLITTSLWRIMYTIFRSLLPTKECEFSCRLVALLHGLTTAFLGINQCFYIDIPFYHPEWRTTYMQSFILALSAGYFIHDFIWCLQYDRNDKLMLAHHIYSVVFLVRILFKGISGAQTTCGLGAMELTNPFLQVRWFMRNEGLYPTLLFLTTETVFLIVYFILRMLLGTYFTWVIITHPKNDYEFVIFTLIIYLISWMFLLNIVQYVLQKYLNINVKWSSMEIEAD